jgi:hypothetical protein
VGKLVIDEKFGVLLAEKLLIRVSLFKLRDECLSRFRLVLLGEYLFCSFDYSVNWAFRLEWGFGLEVLG